jgi:hypothetical protein
MPYICSRVDGWSRVGVGAGVEVEVGVGEVSIVIVIATASPVAPLPSSTLHSALFPDLHS